LDLSVLLQCVGNARQSRQPAWKGTMRDSELAASNDGSCAAPPLPGDMAAPAAVDDEIEEPAAPMVLLLLPPLVKMPCPDTNSADGNLSMFRALTQQRQHEQRRE